MEMLNINKLLNSNEISEKHSNSEKKICGNFFTKKYNCIILYMILLIVVLQTVNTILGNSILSELDHNSMEMIKNTTKQIKKIVKQIQKNKNISIQSNFSTNQDISHQIPEYQFNDNFDFMEKNISQNIIK